MYLNSEAFDYNILIVFFLGLGLLLFSDLIGFLLFKSARKNVFFSTFLGLLLILSVYAIVKAKFNSIGLLVVLWLIGYEFFVKRDKPKIGFTIKQLCQRSLIITSLWILIFLLKFAFFWNVSYNSPNLMFIDYQYYMKIAEGYNLTGNENAMGLKNQILSFLDFAQPYRSNDLWIVSLGLDLTGLDTIYIWELFYSIILITLCSLSLFTLLEKMYNKIISVFFSVFFLFAFSGQWYRDIINFLFKTTNAGSYDPIGIIAYTKLAIVFSIFFQFFNFYLQKKKQEAVYLILLIPLLVQSAVGAFLFAAIFILFEIFKEKENILINGKKYVSILIVFSLLLISFFIFYKINQGIENDKIGSSNLDIINNQSILNFVIVFIKKSVLLFVTYYWLSFLCLFLLFFSVKTLEKKIRIELFIITLVIYLVSILVYTQFVNVGDAYQFSTNLFGPFIISLIIFITINIPFQSVFGKTCLLILVSISVVGMKQIIGGENVFHSVKRIENYDRNFIKQMKVVLRDLNYPFGIIYYGKDFNNFPREDFPQHQTTFLKLFGRNYDAFNIQADSLQFRKKASLQKENLYIKKNALNIWLNNKNKNGIKNNNNRVDFFNSYPFSFCISKIEINLLPHFIKKDIIKSIKDPKTGVYFYVLNNSNKLKVYKSNKTL